MTSMPLSLIAFLAALLIGGVVVLIRGLRGRVIDGHPLCRACGFDLFGLPADSSVCSECGADLSAPRATRIGHRQRRTALTTLGLLLAVVGVGGLGVLGWGTASNIRWIEHAPYWYVLRQSHSGDLLDRNVALNELVRRLVGGKLSNVQISALVAQDLAAQANPKIPWLAPWGDFIESARSLAKVSNLQWTQYLSNAAQYRLNVRSQVRRAENIPIQIVQDKVRCGTRPRIHTWTRAMLEPGGLALPEDNWLGTRHLSGDLYSVWGGAEGYFIRLDPRRTTAASDGPKILRLWFRVDLYDRPTDGTPRPVVSKLFHLEAPWTLVSTNTTTAKAIEDPGARETVESAIQIDRVTAPSTPQGLVRISVRVNRPPVPLAYDILLRAHDREWDLASFTADRGVYKDLEVGGSAKDFDARFVDVIFRPSAELARSTINMTQYWNGEIVVKNVPVQWPTTQPGGK